MNIRLSLMTKSGMQEFFRGFAWDPDTFEDRSPDSPYSYDPQQADAFFEKHNRPDRVHFAVMLGDEVIGDMYLKHIDREHGSCTLSIHMQNDSVKNRGYGTAAEILAVQYAFGELGLNTVFADALKKNLRSRHVLEKVGFAAIGEDERLCYYRLDKGNWSPLEC